MTGLHYRDQYKVLKKLGEGSFGVVHKCCRRDTEQIVAIKTILFDGCGGVPSSVIREVALLKEMDHPNIVKLLDVLSTEDKVSLVFEYVQYDLGRFMEKNPSMTQDPQFIKRLLHDILSALLYCHSNRIIHRDLKFENLLINSQDRVVKLADFGLARALDFSFNSLTKQVGNFLHRAPEILLGSGLYSTPADIWAVGCIFGQLANQRFFIPAYRPVNMLENISRVIGTPDEQIWPGVTKLFPNVNKLTKYPPTNLAELFPDLEPAGVDLLSRMWRWNPSDRITAAEALRHEYFRDIHAHS